MKKVLSILIVCFLCSSLSAQDLSNGIIFKNAIPSWSHVILDSLSINDDYASHMLTNKNLKVNDSIMISALHISNTEFFEGSYIEAINTYEGKKVWDNFFNISTSGGKEYLQKMYINEAGNIEMLCYREVTESIVNIYGKSQLSIRVYNTENGELISHTFLPSPKGVDLLPFSQRNDIIKSDDRYIFIDDNSHPYTYEKLCKSFNNHAVVQDSFIISHKTKYLPYYVKQIYPYKENEFISSRYSTSQIPTDSLTSDAYDLNEFKIDFYNSSLTLIDSLELLEPPPYNWNKTAKSFVDDLIIVDSFDSLSLLNKHYFARSIYNPDGTELVTFDIQNDWFYGVIDTKKIPNSDKFICVYPFEDLNGIRYWNFLLGSPNKTVEQIASIELESNQNVYITSMEILNDRSIIITYDGNYTDSIGIERNTNGVVSFKADSFETLSDKVVDTNNRRISISPNPVASICQVKIFSNKFETLDITIHDSLGKQIQARKVILDAGDNNITLDLSHQDSGIKFIYLTNHKDIFLTKKVIKI